MMTNAFIECNLINGNVCFSHNIIFFNGNIGRHNVVDADITGDHDVDIVNDKFSVDFTSPSYILSQCLTLELFDLHRIRCIYSSIWWFWFIILFRLTILWLFSWQLILLRFLLLNWCFKFGWHFSVEFKISLEHWTFSVQLINNIIVFVTSRWKQQNLLLFLFYCSIVDNKDKINNVFIPEKWKTFFFCSANLRTAFPLTYFLHKLVLVLLEFQSQFVCIWIYFSVIFLFQ